MQLAIDIQNENIAEKIIKLLEVFKNDGVEIISKKAKVENRDESLFTKEYIKKNWKELVMTNENPNIDDDEVLPQAYWEYHNEKHTNR